VARSRLAAPPNLTDRERALALVFQNALEMTAEDRWWRHDLPLPAHQPGTRP
jgi:hypothetical protein